jgi:uncharacterized membrane protein YfcA
MPEFSAEQIEAILPFIAIGFFAQLVDGALGMAFGVIANTSLIAMGVPPALASSYVHIIKAFTGGISGVSHILHRNVDWKLCLRLSIAGIIGGVVGVFVLTNIHAEVARPIVLAYLTAIGFYILWRGLGHHFIERKAKIVEPVGLVGGFLDATGGGGWGPVVTSNLLIQGNNVRMTVGTVNVAEFFLAIAISATFIVSLGSNDLTEPVIGLLIGGIVAAPAGAWLTKHIPARPLMVLVGTVLVLSSLFGIYKALS